MATYFLVALGGSITMGIYGYVSDQSKPSNRRFRISAVEMVMFGGGIFGPIGYGYWIKESGYFYPGLITVGGGLINILYIIFFVPDTIRVNNSQRPQFCSLAPFKKAVRLFTHDNGTNRRWKLCYLYVAVLFVSLAYSDGFTSRLELNPPLCWNSVTIGKWPKLCDKYFVNFTYLNKTIEGDNHWLSCDAQYNNVLLG